MNENYGVPGGVPGMMIGGPGTPSGPGAPGMIMGGVPGEPVVPGGGLLSGGGSGRGAIGCSATGCC